MYFSFVVLFLINVIEIEPFSAVVYGIALIIVAILYRLSKKYILLSHEEELKSRTPMFTRLNQSVNGLIQIKLFSKPGEYMKNIFSEIDYSFRTGNLSFFCYKGIEAFYAYVGTISTIILLYIGIKMVDRREDYSVFAVGSILLIFAFTRGTASLLLSEG